ncbi:TPA: hypothetical protein ACS7Z1_001195 [Providencia alcalifaciens]
MKIDKLKITKIIINLACKAPVFFPTKITSILGQKTIMDGISEKIKIEADKINGLSILEGDYSWDYVNISFLVDDEELKKINKWIYYNRKQENGFTDSSSFDKSLSVSNIGCIPLNNAPGFKDFNPIYVSSEYFDSIQMFLTRYSSGFSFVTLNFNLNKSVNEIINNIPIPKFDNYYEFTHFNFFSRKPLSLKFNHYAKFLDKVIVSTIKEVSDASVRLTELMINDFGIKDKNKKLFNVLSFQINKSSAYFNEENKNPDNRYVLYPSKSSWLHTELSSNDKESFIIGDVVKVDGVNMIYLNTSGQGGNVSYNDAISLLSCSGSELKQYLPIVSFFLIKTKLNELINRVGQANIYSKKKKISKFHDEIFGVFQEIKMVKVWIDKLNENYFLLISTEYHSFIDNEVSYLYERLTNLEKIVNDSYLISENRVQIENIKFGKFNSKLIVLLVLIQIFFAAMTIDFTKKDAWYAPIVGFFMEF